MIKRLFRDARNHLVALDNGGSASFAYDPFGRRFSKTVYGLNTGFLYDGVNVVQELSGSSPSANLLSGGIDEVFSRTDSTADYSFVSDGLGSTLALTDSTGAIQQSYTYDPYGSTSTTGNSSTNSYQYTGRESDATGLYYLRARYYNPATGRFISEDPTGFAGGINLYAYAGDSPTNWSDPFGYGPGDKWYGFNDRDFQDCFHRNWKQPGDPDAGPEDMEDAYNEWKSLGSRTRDAKGERRMAGRGSCEPQNEPEPAAEPEPAMEPEPATEPEDDPNLLQRALNYAGAHPGQVAIGAGVVIVGGVAIVLTGGAAAPVVALAF